MCSCDYEGAEFYSEDYRKARKVHHCEDCGSVIPVGAIYIHATSKWEGQMYSNDLCLRCDSLRAGHRAVDPHCNPTLGELRECMIEAFAELPWAKRRDAALKFRAARDEAIGLAHQKYAAKIAWLKARRVTTSTALAGKGEGR